MALEDHRQTAEDTDQGVHSGVVMLERLEVLVDSCPVGDQLVGLAEDPHLDRANLVAEQNRT